MNEGFAWGGRNNFFYYEITTGAVIGGIEETEDGLFMAGLDHRRQWTYIDVDSARKAVEETHRREIESWKVFTNKDLEKLDEKMHEKPTKKFWEIWK